MSLVNLASADRPDVSAGRAAARVAVVDLGSNSVRMVVYDHSGRAPLPVFNERALCGLGRDLGTTGRLSPEGVAEARTNLRRLCAIARAMQVDDVTVLATAATREAADGPAFLAEIENEYGLEVRQLTGEEEARLSALGVVSAIPGAHGVMGDFGGGSLEMVALDRGTLGQHATLPFGALRLDGDNDRDVDQALARLTWLGDARGRTFYPVGGTWRTLARLHMAGHGHPVRVIHHYEMAYRDAVDYCDLIAGLGPASLARIDGVPRARAHVLPAAARVLRSVLTRIRPGRLVFSAYGLREGFLYERLDDDTRRIDPLIAGSAALGAREGRFGGAELIFDWITPVFPGENAAERRLRLAACHLADIAWSEHPDYRAEHAFLRVLRLPVVGIDHGERAALALAIGARYGGHAEDEIVSPVRALLTPERHAWAMVLGAAQRLALTLAGGAAQPLADAKLVLDQENITLALTGDARDLNDGVVKARLGDLARRLDRAPSVTVAG